MLRKKIEEIVKGVQLDDKPYDVAVDDIIDAFREVLPEKLSEVYEQAVKVNNYAWGSDLDFDDARIGWNKCIEEIESKLK